MVVCCYRSRNSEVLHQCRLTLLQHWQYVDVVNTSPHSLVHAAAVLLLIT